LWGTGLLLTGAPPFEGNDRLVVGAIGVLGAGEEDLVETDELLPE